MGHGMTFWGSSFALSSLLAGLIFIPTVRKAGYSGWWALLAAIPLVGLVLLWYFAWARWPARPDR